MLRHTTYKSIAAGAITLALAARPGRRHRRAAGVPAPEVSDLRSADAMDSDLRSAARQRTTGRRLRLGRRRDRRRRRSSAAVLAMGGGAVVVDVAPARGREEPPCRAEPALYHPGTRPEEWVPG